MNTATVLIKPASLRLQLKKGDRTHSHEAHLFGPTNEAVPLDEFESADEALRWIARYGVQRYCGLPGVLSSALSNDGSSSDSMQTEVVVKVLVDAHYVPMADAMHVRNTSLLLLQGLEQPAPVLSVASLAFCLSFIHRTVTRWESLEAGQSFELEFAQSS